MNKEINIKIFPIQLIFKIKIEKIPKTNKISEFLIYLDLSFLPFPSIFIKYEIKTGLITRATNKDDNRVTIIPIGRKLINFPVNPGQNAKGTNTAKVVPVDVIIGSAISPIPNFVASILEYPFSKNL